MYARARARYRVSSRPLLGAVVCTNISTSVPAMLAMAYAKAYNHYLRVVEAKTNVKPAYICDD
jgi:hypothetical protein